MTSPGQFAAQDGSFARSAGGAAGRGVILIVIAVAIGLYLLAKGFDGGGTSLAASPADDIASEPSADASTDGTDASTDGTDSSTDEADSSTDGTDSSTDTPAEPDTANPPGEVKVVSVNATGEPGLAGTATGILDTQGYVTAAKNASSVPTEGSAIYYQAGYSEDAKAVASILGIPADLILPAPADVVSLVANNDDVTDFNVFVIQGTDRLAG